MKKRNLPQKRTRFASGFNGFGWVMIFFWLVTAGFVVHTCLFLAGSQKAICTITKVEIVKGGGGGGGKYGGHGGGTSYHPTINYTDRQGQRHEVYFTIGATHYDYHVDQTVPILYDPENPQSVRFDSFLGIWALTLVPGVCTAFLTFMLVAGEIYRRYSQSELGRQRRARRLKGIRANKRANRR